MLQEAGGSSEPVCSSITSFISLPRLPCFINSPVFLHPVLPFTLSYLNIRAYGTYSYHCVLKGSSLKWSYGLASQVLYLLPNVGDLMWGATVQNTLFTFLIFDNLQSSHPSFPERHDCGLINFLSSPPTISLLLKLLFIFLLTDNAYILKKRKRESMWEARGLFLSLISSLLSLSSSLCEAVRTCPVSEGRLGEDSVWERE